MFKFVKQTFILAMIFFSCNLPGVNSLSCISIKNQERKTRPQVINVNSNNPIFYPFGIKTSKCSANCNILTIRMQKCVFLTLQKI